jgi:hypothetical protein
MKRHTIIATMLLALWVGGCPPTNTKPIIDMRPTTEAGRQFEARWQASLKVLRSYRFKIDLQDRRRGLIKTEPMMARYLFEFWRSDASSLYDVAEGTMHTVFVIASVNVTRIQPDGDDYTLDVVVHRVRSNKVEAQIVGSAGVQGGVYEVIDADGDKPYEPEGGSMVLLGTDETLARELQYEIQSELPSQLSKLSIPPQ